MCTTAESPGDGLMAYVQANGSYPMACTRLFTAALKIRKRYGSWVGDRGLIRVEIEQPSRGACQVWAAQAYLGETLGTMGYILHPIPSHEDIAKGRPLARPPLQRAWTEVRYCLGEAQHCGVDDLVRTKHHLSLSPVLAIIIIPRWIA